MKTRNRGFNSCLFATVVSVAGLLFSGCQFKVPITDRPSRDVDPKLVGEWRSEDGKEKLTVRRFHRDEYVVLYEEGLFRAYHSDLGGTPFVTVQMLESDDSEGRAYAYFVYRLEDNGQRLVLRAVSDQVVPKDTGSSAKVRKILRKNLNNPSLLEEPGVFLRAK